MSALAPAPCPIMDRRAPHTARPAAGASWFSLARLVVLLQGLMPLFWFLGWFLLDGMDRDFGGFGLEVESGIWFWLNELLQWILSRGWKGNRWKRFKGLYNALDACVYFAWSPDLARIGLLVVCGVVGWIITFTHALYLRASEDSDETNTASLPHGGPIIVSDEEDDKARVIVEKEITETDGDVLFLCVGAGRNSLYIGAPVFRRGVAWRGVPQWQCWRVPTWHDEAFHQLQDTIPREFMVSGLFHEER
ncbi:hypothetical protein C8F04DRAFT_1195621 [Mycena alexandri]|uniref:Uncharacterized protein n=1 Tax=Mycena alexandri TaxID=1745969 RepID=A0AAD6S548_9AGAR|nr:hypothetical protein C8F04DRAFT_1195621 [Mycena alexandri]